MKKKTIIAIVGASGSGKTSLSLALKKYMDIPAICSFTTRPKRDGEIDGVDHWFVGGKVLTPVSPFAYTNFGGYEYWTELWQFKHRRCSYVVDEAGLIDLKTKWGNVFKVISIYINKDNDVEIDEARIKRDEDRANLPLSEYDIVINNDCPYREFVEKSIQIIKQHLTKQ